MRIGWLPIAFTVKTTSALNLGGKEEGEDSVGRYRSTSASGQRPLPFAILK